MKNKVIIFLIALVISNNVCADYKMIIGIDNIKPAEDEHLAATNWELTGDNVNDWVSGETECSNWSPATEEFEFGIVFTQEGSECRTKRERVIEKRMKNIITGDYKIISTDIETYIDYQVTKTRSAMGSKM